MRQAREVQEPRYTPYQLEGGRNYRELVLSMPTQEVPLNRYTAELLQMSDGAGEYQISIDGRFVGNPVMAKTPEEAIQAAVSRQAPRSKYTSSHFDTPNYVAHMRINERVDADGRSGLFLEEIQSDRHQQGRDRGYREDATDTATQEEISRFYNGRGDMPEAEWKELVRRVKNESIRREGIADAPFRKDWPLQMFKRALAEAASSGKQWIGWTDGLTQVDRYTESLRQRVRSIEWSNQDGLTIVDVKPTKGDRIYLPVKEGKIYRTADQASLRGEDLASVIGKEAASKVNESASGKLEGQDLTIGGEGMKGFYDQILPKEISKYVKQWGGKVEKVKIGLENSLEELRFNLFNPENRAVTAFLTTEEAQAAARKAGKGYTVRETPLKNPTPIWRVNITPQMREGIKKAGQALFVGGMAAVVAEEEL
jgi:hypothetical protein